MRLLLIAPLVGLLSLAPVFTVWAGSQEDVAAVADRWAQAFSAGNVEGIIALYDARATLFGTRSPRRSDGREAIRQYFVATFAGSLKRQVTFIEPSIRVFDDAAAVNTGYYQFTIVLADGQPRAVPARYSFTLVKHDGNWLIVDHHSSVLPGLLPPAR